MMRSLPLKRSAGRLRVFALETAKQRPRMGNGGNQRGGIREGQGAGKGEKGGTVGREEAEWGRKECEGA